MEEAVLVVAVAAVFVFGFFLMGRLDHFLERNREAIRTETEKDETNCLKLPDSIPPEEATKIIERFRREHTNSQIFLCSGSEDEIAAYILDHLTDGKRVS